MRGAYHPSVTDDLRYPVGKYEFRPDTAVSAADRAILIGQIADAPARLAAEVAGLSDAQLDTPYRPEWMDRAASRASCARQPSERVHPLQAHRYRGSAEAQDVQRRPRGPSSSTGAAARSTSRWCCSRRCISGGSRSCARSMSAPSRARECIRSTAPCASTTSFSSTRGTGDITWHIFTG